LDLCSRVAVVLVAPRNPLNIGAAARAMSNFGFFDLRLVRPYDAAYKEARSAVGASRVLEQSRVFDSVAAAVADANLVAGTTSAHHRELAQPLLRLEKATSRLHRHPGRICLLFGSEKFGLGNDDLAYCHFLVRIPTRDEHGSMNLGQAVAVCLYELIRNPRASSPAPTPGRKLKPAAAADEERLTLLLLDALRESGYIPSRSSASVELKVRRLIRRLRLSAGDAEIWQGMVRQILWRISYPKDS
jgi:tRNA/rRNA methyltransferase